MPDATPGWPAWIRRRDGRSVPFDPDAITQTLFAATEAQGRPDAFLARELTDGVLHFLQAEGNQDSLTTDQMSDLIVKVVRELGLPDLAQVVSQGRSKIEESGIGDAAGVTVQPATDPEQVRKNLLRQWGLETVYSRDLVSAHREGLLAIHHLERPDALDRCVLPVPADALHSEAWWESLLDHGPWLADGLALDGLDHLFAQAERDEDIPAWLRRLGQWLEACRLKAILNLDSASPPPALRSTSQGPLFAAAPAAPGRQQQTARIVLQEIQRGFRGRACLHLAWQVRADDPPDIHQLLAAMPWEQVLWSWERPRRPTPLDRGLSRRHSAVLLRVGLGLSRLVEMPGVAQHAERFLAKLPSLARMAIRVGVQKRLYLRQRLPEAAAVQRGFLLERARLLVAPLGLDSVVRRLLGQGIVDSKFSRELGQSILRCLQEALQKAGAAVNLEAVLDLPPLVETDIPLPAASNQLTTLDALLAIPGEGVGTIVCPAAMTDQQWLELVGQASQKTGLRLVERRAQVH